MSESLDTIDGASAVTHTECGADLDPWNDCVRRAGHGGTCWPSRLDAELLDRLEERRQALPFRSSSFTVDVVAPLSGVRRIGRFDDAEEALAAGMAEVGPAQAQVSITATPTPFEHGTFAVRHVTWSPAGTQDSGWRCWVKDEFQP